MAQMRKMSWMSVDKTWFRAGISSEYLLNCKPVFCSTAHWLSAKATTQQPSTATATRMWMHSPYLEGGWVQGAWPCSPSLLPERPSVLLSAFCLMLAQIQSQTRFFILTYCFWHTAIILFTMQLKKPHRFLPVRLNLSIKSKWKFIDKTMAKTMYFSSHRTFSLSNF